MHNIYWNDQLVKTGDRTNLLGHNSCVIWLTGLSGSGKSTLANELERALFQKKIHSYILDGDNLRHGLNSDLSFTQRDRSENIRRLGEVAKLFVDAGLITIVSAISPFKEDREKAKALFENNKYIEIYVKCPLLVCENRDPKGLYKKVRSGEIELFTGVNSPYQEPEEPDLIIETDKLSVRNSIEIILNSLSSKGIIH